MRAIAPAGPQDVPATGGNKKTGPRGDRSGRR